MPDFTSPKIYVEEMANLPSSIVSVDTAVPAFIGYTQKTGGTKAGEYLFAPKKISSLIEYERMFGLSDKEMSIVVSIDATTAVAKASIRNPSPYLVYRSLQLFFANGGGYCYIVSVGDYTNKRVDATDLQKGLNAVAAVDEVTLLLFPDAFNLDTAAMYYGLCKAAMQQCVSLRDRFVITDVWKAINSANDPIATLRSFDFGAAENLRYAAAYYPRIVANLVYTYDDASVTVKANGDSSLAGTLAQLATKNKTLYLKAKDAVSKLPMLLPPSPAIAGIYAQTDNARGVWKAPANTNINGAIVPEVNLTDTQNEALNVDPVGGKSINAIRSFPGRGTATVWGARTLAGNDNEARYISVRRFLIMIEESIREGTNWVVFEPNDQNTWNRVRSSIENYLTQLWRAGALMGAKTSEAFFVGVGLGQTMTQTDILEGRLIVEIGVAVLRPAEFILLRIVHKLNAP